MIEALYRFTDGVTYHALTFNGQVICEAQAVHEGLQELARYSSGLKTKEELLAADYNHMDHLDFIYTIQSMLRYWIKNTK